MSVARALIMIGVWVGYKFSPLQSLPSIQTLLAISVIGINFPAGGRVADVGIIVTIPGVSPLADSINAWMTNVPLLATATSVLAFAGTFLGSAVVAEFMMRIWGVHCFLAISPLFRINVQRKNRATLGAVFHEVILRAT